MALTRIILWIGNSLILVALMMAITGVGALAMGEIDSTLRFGAMTLVVGMVGVIFVATTRDTPSRESNTDALAFLLIFWAIIPVVLSLPYLILGQVEHPYTAWFEAVSAVTTTGASSLDPDAIPASLHLWRSFLQWMGGVIAATFAVVILAALNLRGTGIHRSMLFTFKKGELFGRLIGIGRVISGIYAGIAAVSFILLLLSGTPLFDAFCLALTSVSTGGLTPRGDVLATYVNPFGILVLVFTCILGACNVALLWDVARLRRRMNVTAIFNDVEFRAFLVIVAVLFFIGLAYAGVGNGFTVIVEALMFVSSAGFDYHVIGLDMAPPVVLIAIALIGGSALSTAGGVKLIRLLLLFRHLETDLSRLTHPSRTVPVMFRGQVLPDHAFLSIWMYFFGYTMVFAIGIMALAGSGMEYQMAVATSAASLANIGPLLDATLPPYSYESFTLSQQIISAALMLLGRVEVLAAFAIMSPGLWRS